ncbi:hypothetical protein ACHAQJ_007569 [Trichoderma viride]
MCSSRSQPPSLIGTGSGPRCVTRLENLFCENVHGSCVRRIRRTPHLIGAALKTNYVMLGALCLVRARLSRRAAKLVRGLDPDLQWPHDAMSRCLKVGEISRRLSSRSMTLTGVEDTDRRSGPGRPKTPQLGFAWVSEVSSARSAATNPTMPAAGRRKAGHGVSG